MIRLLGEYIRENESIVLKQEALVDEMRSMGLDPSAAQAILDRTRAVLARAHREMQALEADVETFMGLPAGRC